MQRHRQALRARAGRLRGVRAVFNTKAALLTTRSRASISPAASVGARTSFWGCRKVPCWVGRQLPNLAVERGCVKQMVYCIYGGGFRATMRDDSTEPSQIEEIGDWKPANPVKEHISARHNFLHSPPSNTCSVCGSRLRTNAQQVECSLYMQSATTVLLPFACPADTR